MLRQDASKTVDDKTKTKSTRMKMAMRANMINDYYTTVHHTINPPTRPSHLHTPFVFLDFASLGSTPPKVSALPEDCACLFFSKLSYTHTHICKHFATHFAHVHTPRYTQCSFTHIHTYTSFDRSLGSTPSVNVWRFCPFHTVKPRDVNGIGRSNTIKWSLFHIQNV